MEETILRLCLFCFSQFLFFLGWRVRCALLPCTLAFDLPRILIRFEIILLFFCFFSLSQSDYIICTSKYLSGAPSTVSRVWSSRIEKKMYGKKSFKKMFLKKLFQKASKKKVAAFLKLPLSDHLANRLGVLDLGGCLLYTSPSPRD